MKINCATQHIHFKKSDDRYNSGIFDFKKDNLTSSLKIDDDILREIIVDLYYPKCPYNFSILPIEILGSAYERFLGKTIRLTPSHQARVEEKPEVRKAGGVYYTPSYVVDYIIENTVGAIIKGKTPKEIEKVRILDPACGSGTFLVRAYSHILEYHLEYYSKNPKKYKKEIFQISEGHYHLTTDIRKKILVNNIFGVDIDSQAVEITKLSLLLKVLENETKEQVEQQLKLFQERVLPNIDKNIRCGNSLVDSSYFKQTTLTENSEDVLKINPLDWDNYEKGFGHIVKGEKGFDAIIGNPPYVKEYTNNEIFEPVKNSSLSKYYQGKMDFWYFFTCHSIDLLKEGGLHSFIAPNNWITNGGAKILRNKIVSDSKILSFFDFNDFKVFKDADIQTMVFVLEKVKTSKIYSMDYHKIIDKNISKEQLRNYLVTGKDGKHIEKFKVKLNPVNLSDAIITFTTSQVSNVLEKIRENGTYLFKDEDVSTGIDVHQDFVSDRHLEVLKDESIKKGEGIFNLSRSEYQKIKFTQKEKEMIKPFYTTEELFRYYGNSKNHLWVIYSGMEVRKNIKDYPNIKEHLDRFKKIITSDFGPYGLHRAREQRFFEGAKIISLRKTPKPYFTYADFPCYVSQTYFVLKPSDMNLKYLTGLLNSILVFFWLKHRGKRQGEQLQIDKAPLLDIPICKPGNDKEEQEIIRLVDAIRELTKKKQDVKLDSEKEIFNKQINAYEERIDQEVYKLYGITKEEQKIIEENLNKS